MSHKKYLTHPNGCEYMIVDCDDYEVEFTKSEPGGENAMTGGLFQSLIYRHKTNGNNICILGGFFITWELEQDGGKLLIKHKDRWGCEMIFIHFDPVLIKGMFDFIGKGYGVFDELYKDVPRHVSNKDQNYE